VDLVAYSLEELPYFRTENMGSAVHARSLKEAQVKVEVMICLEMIGYFTSEENSQAYPTDLLKTIYPTRGDFIAVIGRLGQGDTVTKVKRSMLENSTIPVQSISAPASLRGIDFSDHQNYWKAGWEAVMITDTSFYRNPNYHQSTDTIDTLDFEKMEQVMEGVYGAVTEWQ
jgi:Zn-dependent M28 family amino/carboxypeptidase